MKNLGDTLKARRRKLHLSIDSLYERLKIHPKYLRALEINDYSVFDSSVHARGFLKIYADALGLDVSEILAIWRREFGYLFEQSSSHLSERSFSERVASRRTFGFSLRSLIYVLPLTLLLGFFVYLYYSYMSYQGPPVLVVESPTNNLVVNTPLVDVLGHTDPDVTLLINGDPLFLKTDGSFATTINLRDGVNTLSVVAINRIGKRTEQNITVVYRPDSSDVDTTTP